MHTHVCMRMPLHPCFMFIVGPSCLYYCVYFLAEERRCRCRLAVCCLLIVCALGLQLPCALLNWLLGHWVCQKGPQVCVCGARVRLMRS